MRHLNGIVLIAVMELVTINAFANQSEEHDPVRDAQRHRDCLAANAAKHDGRSEAAINEACDKAIAEGSYHDPNISLDGIIKSPPPPQ